MQKIEDVLNRIKTYAKSSKRKWCLKSLEEFIISFEKNSQSANEDLAKGYGNIIKGLVRDIMMRDSIIMPNDDREEYVLREIMNDNVLHSNFNKLYTLVLKFEKQRKKNG